MMAEKEFPNLKATTSILVGGVHVAEGEVIPKTSFTVKGDWQNLVFGFSPPRMEETDAAVGKPKANGAPAIPGA